MTVVDLDMFEVGEPTQVIPDVLPRHAYVRVPVLYRLDQDVGEAVVTMSVNMARALSYALGDAVRRAERPR